MRYSQIFSLFTLLFCSFAYATDIDKAFPPTVKASLNETMPDKSKQVLEQEKILALQKKLTTDGYYLGPINGIRTPETRQAFKNWATDRD